MTALDTVMSRLKTLIANELDVKLSAGQIADDATFFEGGLGLDSIAIVELIALTEDHFGLQFTDAELVPSSFRSVRVLSDVIAGKLTAASA